MAKGSKEKPAEVPEKDAVEIELEKAVFGDFEGFESGLKELDLDAYGSDYDMESSDEEKSHDEEENQIEAQDGDLFFVDEGGDSDEDKMDEDEEESSEESESESDSDGNAWDDSDDEKMQISLTSSDRIRKLRKTMQDNYISGREYSRRLRDRFEKVYPRPKWTSMEALESNSSDDEAMDEDEDMAASADPLAALLKTTSTYVSKKSAKLLPPTNLDIVRLKDANHAAASHSAIQTLNFHPSHSLMLSSGYDRTLRMYHVDGKSNPVATTLHVRESPFQTAQFHPDGRRVFAAGRRRYLYIWDIETGGVTKITRMYGHEQTQRSMEKFELSPCGRFIALIGGNGWMNMLSASNGQWIAGAKVEGIIADIAWHKDGERISIVTTSGEVSEWDVNARKVCAKWRDEGSVGITTIALGGKNDRWCAIGSQSGIVNVYDRLDPTIGFRPSQDEAPTYKPRAVITNLVTTISSLQFSPDGQILAMASRAKRDALRLIHVPSFTAFRNWPTSGTPLGKVTAIAFTPGSEMLCTGNEAGYARLWKLNHYC